MIEKLKARRAGTPVPREPALPGMTIAEPPVLPFHGTAFIRRRNGRALAGLIKDWCAEHGVDQAAVWISVPTAESVLAHLKGLPVLYYCCDDFGGLAGVDHKTALAAEHRLAARADKIVVTSDALAQKFPAGKTALIPHGVDFDLFTTDTPRAPDLPAGKVAGFYGSLSSWLDTGLLADTAKLRPDWHFFLIGQVEADMAQLEGLANVHLAGPRDHRALPAYAQHWSASLLPFRDTPQIRACNPLKLREYLAAGPAVISTDFPEARRYTPEITLIEPNAHALSEALDASLTSSLEDRNTRRARVAGEAWTARAQAVKLFTSFI